jgi:hypothetical protein
MGGGSLGSAPERLGSGGCDAHACRDYSGGWELAGGHGGGGGVHVRGHACGQPCGLAISPLELTSAVDHGWIARWANNLGHVLA